MVARAHRLGSGLEKCVPDRVDPLGAAEQRLRRLADSARAPLLPRRSAARRGPQKSRRRCAGTPRSAPSVAARSPSRRSRRRRAIAAAATRFFVRASRASMCGLGRGPSQRRRPGRPFGPLGVVDRSLLGVQRGKRALGRLAGLVDFAETRKLRLDRVAFGVQRRERISGDGWKRRRRSCAGSEISWRGKLLHGTSRGLLRLADALESGTKQRPRIVFADFDGPIVRDDDVPPRCRVQVCEMPTGARSRTIGPLGLLATTPLRSAEQLLDNTGSSPARQLPHAWPALARRMRRSRSSCAQPPLGWSIRSRPPGDVLRSRFAS